MQENNRSLGLDQDLGLGLSLDQTEMMNQPVDHIWLSCAICVLTIMVNTWAIRVVKTKEDTSIRRVVKWDCLSNILIAVEALLSNYDVGFPLNISAICAVRNATVISLIFFTRLVPVAIVLLRYIMVCHPIFYINCGKEKVIWKWILRSVIFLCLANWINNIYTSSIAFRFLRCMGREEDFG